MGQGFSLWIWLQYAGCVWIHLFLNKHDSHLFGRKAWNTHLRTLTPGFSSLISDAAPITKRNKSTCFPQNKKSTIFRAMKLCPLKFFVYLVDNSSLMAAHTSMFYCSKAGNDQLFKKVTCQKKFFVHTPGHRYTR